MGMLAGDRSHLLRRGSEREADGTTTGDGGGRADLGVRLPRVRAEKRHSALEVVSETAGGKRQKQARRPQHHRTTARTAQPAEPAVSVRSVPSLAPYGPTIYVRFAGRLESCSDRSHGTDRISTSTGQHRPGSPPLTDRRGRPTFCLPGISIWCNVGIRPIAGSSAPCKRALRHLNCQVGGSAYLVRLSGATLAQLKSRWFVRARPSRLLSAAGSILQLQLIDVTTSLMLFAPRRMDLGS